MKKPVVPTMNQLENAWLSAGDGDVYSGLVAIRKLLLAQGYQEQTVPTWEELMDIYNSAQTAHLVRFEEQKDRFAGWKAVRTHLLARGYSEQAEKDVRDLFSGKFDHMTVEQFRNRER